MKTFKQFLTEAKITSIGQYASDNSFGKDAGIAKDGTPMALIGMNRIHIPNFGIDPSGMPMALVGNTRKFKKYKLSEEYLPDLSQFAPIPKSSSKDEEAWFHNHDENASYGANPIEQGAELHNWQDNDPLEQHTRAYSRHSADLNKSLLDHGLRGREHPKKFFDELHAFDLQKLDTEVGKHKLDHPLHTYSGVGFHPGKLAAQHPEGHVTLPAYTSTSLDKNVAKGFADTAGYVKDKGTPLDKHIIHFKLPKGQRGKFIGKNSEYPGEQEYLLPRNTKIKIHPKPKMVKRLGKIYHVWTAHPIDPETEAE